MFNDLAVAAAVLLREKLANRVLVVDLDVHQGDGTAAIFRGNNDVFTFSMHAEKNFPLRKAPSDLDIGLRDGTEDEEYLSKLRENLPQIMDSFQPDFVLYDAGVDVHRNDALGRLG